MKNLVRSAGFILLLLGSIACGPAPVAQPRPAADVQPIPVSESNSAGSEANTEPGLIWEGFTEFGDGNAETCKSLRVGPGSQAVVGECETIETAGQVQEFQNQAWTEMLDRFAPFEYSSDAEKVIFRGTGQIEGPAWQRAIATWARFTYGELFTGRVGAAVRTSLSWSLGEVPGQPGSCGRLLVLNFGYAYRNVEPCGGGQLQSTVGGWLETDELEQFDAWLYGREAVYQNDSYFAGEGAQPMSEAEQAELATWVESVYGRLGN